jgi:hypothetical protein
MGENLSQQIIWLRTNIQNLQEAQKFNPQRINNPMKKWAHELHREFSMEEIKMTKNYMKKCSKSLAIKCKSKLY